MSATLQPLGDQAILAHLPNEAAAARWAAAVRNSRPPWLIDVVPAYLSVAVFFDARLARHSQVSQALAQVRADASAATAAGRLHVIPCCYELQLDLARVARHCGLRPEQVVELHSGRDYSIYAIGFCPGFPYLGYLPDELSGVPRLESPRLLVEPGCVGLTGRQTGIYPLPRPGGWNLIGRTPLRIVDLENGLFPLRVGDRVRFQPVSGSEFNRLAGQKLDSGENTNPKNS